MASHHFYFYRQTEVRSVLWRSWHQSQIKLMSIGSVYDDASWAKGAVSTGPFWMQLVPFSGDSDVLSEYIWQGQLLSLVLIKLKHTGRISSSLVKNTYMIETGLGSLFCLAIIPSSDLFLSTPGHLQLYRCVFLLCSCCLYSAAEANVFIVLRGSQLAPDSPGATQRWPETHTSGWFSRDYHGNAINMNW